MKHQALFPKKDKSKKINCRLLQFLFGHLELNFANTHWQISQTMFFVSKDGNKFAG